MGIDGKALLERFSGVSYKVDVAKWHTFGRPVYVLDEQGVRQLSALGITPVRPFQASSTMRISHN